MASSSSTNARYVCWEWLRDDGLGFSPYNPEDSWQIECVYCNDRKGKVRLKDSEIDLRKKMDSKGHKVSRKTNISLPTDDLAAYWLWCSMVPSTFVCYDIAANVDIEKGYINYCNRTGKEILNLSNCPCRIPYTINYANMNQTRHGYMTVREIKRVQLAQGQTLQFLLRAQDNPPSVTPLHSTSAHTSYSYGTSSLTTASTGISHATGYSSGAMAGVGGAGVGGASGPILQPSVLSGHYASGFHGNPAATSLCINCFGITCTCGHITTTAAHSANLTSGTTRSGRKYLSSVSPPSTATARITPVVTSVSSSSHSATAKSSRSRRKAATGKTSPPASKRTSPTATKSGRKKSSKKGKKKAEEEEEEESSAGGREDLMVHFKKLKKLHEKDDEPCPICMNKLSEQSGFDDDDDTLPTPTQSSLPLLYKLRKCGHKMHYSCLKMYLKSQGQASGFQCPTCKVSYGVKTGDMPDGNMSLRKSRTSLPGHSGCGMLEIVYDFRPGVHNGRSYRANGFPRVCYLPDSPKGNKVLKLLGVAWERRLTFTIGTSVTTGASDTVVWNEIHHKTESTSNHSGHGYPDPDYLDRVLVELAAQGVTEEDQDEHQDQSSSEDSDA